MELKILSSLQKDKCAIYSHAEFLNSAWAPLKKKSFTRVKKKKKIHIYSTRDKKVKALTWIWINKRKQIQNPLKNIAQYINKHMHFRGAQIPLMIHHLNPNPNPNPTTTTTTTNPSSYNWAVCF